MAVRCKYLISDARTGVSQIGTAEYLSGLLFVPQDAIRKAARDKTLLKGHWKVELETYIKDMDPKLRQEWDKTMELFKDVTWVKEGGRKLKFKKRG